MKTHSILLMSCTGKIKVYWIVRYFTINNVNHTVYQVIFAICKFLLIFSETTKLSKWIPPNKKNTFKGINKSFESAKIKISNIFCIPYSSKIVKWKKYVWLEVFEGYFSNAISLRTLYANSFRHPWTPFQGLPWFPHKYFRMVIM